MPSPAFIDPVSTKEYSWPKREPGKKYKLEDYYRPSQEVQTFIYKVYEKLIRWRSLRDQPYQQFNGQPMVSYLRESRQKYWGYIPLTYDTELPQFFFPETRNEINKILAKVANLKLKPSFEGVEGFDVIKSQIFQDLFSYWSRNKGRNVENFWQYLYNIINGTAVVFTAYQSDVKEVKNITKYNSETGISEFATETLDNSEVGNVIVNLEDLFIPKLWEPDIQKQGELCWRVLMKWHDFQEVYKDYELKDYVMPGSMFADPSIYIDFLSYDIRGDDFVEVIKYFNADLDQYAIIANGVLLNPVKDEKMEFVAPMPWNHKKLPFSKTIFEPIDANFFYGMSLAQKVKSPQDALNKMWELMLDREQRSVAAPIITNDPSVELGLEFRAGRVYQVQADPVSGYRELAMQPTSPSYWNALNSLDGLIQRTGSGTGGNLLISKQPRSAKEASIQDQEQDETAGLYFMFYKHLLEQEAWLVMMNMIQFYTATKTSDIMGDAKYNKILRLANVDLVNGGKGNRELRITGSPMKSKDLAREAYIRSLLTKEKVEIIEVTPTQLKQVNFDIKIDFEQERTPQTERAMYLDYISTVMQLFGQTGLIDMQKVLQRVSEKFGENLADISSDQAIEAYEAYLTNGGPTGIPSQGQPEQASGGPASLPAVNKVNQGMRGMQFGGQGGAQRGGAPAGPSAQAIIQSFGRK